MKTHASFTIVHVTNDKVFLVDNGVGKSVTNDAEDVVAAVILQHRGKRIIYQDTEGRWDELVHAKGSFVGFAPYSEWLPTPC